MHHIQEYFKKNRGRERKSIKARHEERREKIRVIVRAKLDVGYWELIPMESGADNSAYQDTSEVTNELE